MGCLRGDVLHPPSLRVFTRESRLFVDTYNIFIYLYHFREAMFLLLSTTFLQLSHFRALQLYSLCPPGLGTTDVSWRETPGEFAR